MQLVRVLQTLDLAERLGGSYVDVLSRLDVDAQALDEAEVPEETGAVALNDHRLVAGVAVGAASVAGDQLLLLRNAKLLCDGVLDAR